MRIIPLAAVPQQSLSVRVADRRHVITIKTARGCMVASVERDGVLLVQSARLVAGEPILRYPYLQDGNFLLQTVGDEMPWWEAFGTTQTLYYLTADEVAAIQDGGTTDATRIPAGAGYPEPVPTVLEATSVEVRGVARIGSTIEVELASVTYTPTVDIAGAWDFATPSLLAGSWPIRARYVTPVPSSWSEPFVYVVT